MTDDESAPVTLTTQVCENAACPWGENGEPKVYVPGRHWSKFCCKACRMKNASLRRAAANKMLRDAEAV